MSPEIWCLWKFTQINFVFYFFEVLDKLCVDIRALNALVKETQRNIFNILIQEVLTFVIEEIPDFAVKMKKLVNVLNKLEHENLDPEEEQNIIDDRFVTNYSCTLIKKHYYKLKKIEINLRPYQLIM